MPPVNPTNGGTWLRVLCLAARRGAVLGFRVLVRLGLGIARGIGVVVPGSVVPGLVVPGLVVPGLVVPGLVVPGLVVLGLIVRLAAVGEDLVREPELGHVVEAAGAILRRHDRPDRQNLTLDPL